MTKADLRRRLREQRRALAPETQRAAARQLAENLATVHAFRTSRHVACYLPHDGEIGTSGIIERLWRRSRTCYLPVLSPLTHGQMRFAPAPLGVELAANSYGIFEPLSRSMIGARDLDLILLPLVGFDETGRRLGMGGGYYDRSLAFLHLRRYWRKPRVIGLAYDFQKLEALPDDLWDVALDAVVTESTVYRTQAK